MVMAWQTLDLFFVVGIDLGNSNNGIFTMNFGNIINNIVSQNASISYNGGNNDTGDTICIFVAL